MFVILKIYFVDKTGNFYKWTGEEKEKLNNDSVASMLIDSIVTETLF